MEEHSGLESVKGLYVKNRVVLAALLWMMFGIVYLFGAMKQGLFLKGVPGPGFLPFLCGAALAICAAIVIAIDMVKRFSRTQQDRTSPEAFDRAALVRVIFAFAALFAYSFLLDYIGFTIGTFLFMLASLRIMEPKSWRFTVLVSLAVAVIAYVLFVLVLEVSLPKSLLGFI